MKRQYNLLLHPAFILSLFLLLLNDISLKYQFANIITGKLSDFTGLFVFAMFGTAILPRFRKMIVVITALLFIWWKSTLATPFINWWNLSMPVSLQRVVDYTDLIALIVLPLVLLIPERDQQPFTRYRRLFVPLIGGVSIFSFCFTSSPYRYGYYSFSAGEVNFAETVETRLSEQEILDRFGRQGITYKIDSISYYRAREYSPRDAYVIRVTTTGGDSIKWVPFRNSEDSLLYIRSNQGKYHLLHRYPVDGYVLENVKLYIEQRNKNKGSRVYIERFDWAANSGELNARMRKKIKKSFKDLLR